MLTARNDKWQPCFEIGVIREIVGEIYFAEFSPGTEVLTASDDCLAQIWPAHFSEEPSASLVKNVCIGRLGGISILTRDEMRLAGYPDTMALIDVCAK